MHIGCGRIPPRRGGGRPQHRTLPAVDACSTVRAVAPRILFGMVQPAVRIGSTRAARDAARALETPAEVRAFEKMAPDSASLRTFIETTEWRSIRARIMGDDRPPVGRPSSLSDLSRFLRWAADGSFSEQALTPDARGAYLHAAAEVEAFGRNAGRAAPVSPAPAAQPVRVAESLSGLAFAEALLACQAGRHIARTGWAAGGYVTAQAGYPDGIGVNANTARATGLVEGTVVEFGPYLMRCSYFDGRPSFVPWTPGQEDLFARDWRILPQRATA